MMYNLYRAPKIMAYDRERAVGYAHEWAFKRNPKYFDFHAYGGDCTNFASQVLLAGSGVMNYTPVHGWFYISSYQRTASWTGVGFLYDFLVNNKGAGPFAEVVDIKDAEPGDIIQLSFKGGGVYNHAPVVVSAGSPAGLENIKIAAHTYDRDHYPITNYRWKEYRVLHIKGVRG
jgi:hypothetical protein